MQNELLTIPEACKILHYGKTNIYRLIKSGQLPAVKLGKRTLVSRDSINKFIESLPAYNGGMQ